ncbi:ATP phosphoribosyltransferase regulatory subunit [[Clostridium] fimetarium]|uniref:ATP phosphoribosyltransferase regulatory subunit n=1 Tax=[Clostridium] fimetarium TaxID=99656 RepID=A0A1I0RHR1_9FIRM|nr:ATP phosphoribosyltransferase regulatory subunit [[Clostridium] fimetarium]SEW40415.1 ATP phosphoribosyltransferase regulatory subunit [[Clostridium] fimetarium]
MKKKLLHTPEGVRDIHNEECAKKLVLQSRIHDVLNLYGYSDIQTPTFEFFDIFNKERGSVSSNEMFKFFDRDGKTLVLRPDMTPSIARTAAKYYGETNSTLKLCYLGNTFINNSSYQGRLKETTQMGAELIGDDSLDADAEVIAMVIDCLLNSGLKEFQVEIGQVQFLKGLLNEAGISDDAEEELCELILNKSYFGVEELLNTQNIDRKIAETLLLLPQLFGSVEVLEKAKTLSSNPQSLAAIKRLEDLYQLLKVYGYEKYITFDLGMLSKHAYYTGVIFNAYTYGTGDSVVKGGRYDKLIGQFGSDKASIGFSITVDQLMIALERQKIDIPLDKSGTLVLYKSDDRNISIHLSKYIRSIGTNVNMIHHDFAKNIKEYIEYAKSTNLDQILNIKTDKEVEIINVATGVSRIANISSLMGGNNE